MKGSRASADVVLEATALTVTFGPVRALDGVDLTVRRGQILGLIGPNGAGKTTLIDSLTGFVPATGRVRLGEVDLTPLAAHQRARAGLARTWQAADLFDDLTVAENLEVSNDHRWRRAGSARRTQRVEEVLEQLGLTQLRDEQPTALTEGQRKLVGVGRALSADPSVLLLDEPAAGLNSTESAELGRLIAALAGRDRAVVLIDHDMSLVLSVCDVLTVLDFGRVIASGPPDEVRRDPVVLSAYLGRPTEPTRPLEGASDV